MINRVESTAPTLEEKLNDVIQRRRMPELLYCFNQLVERLGRSTKRLSNDEIGDMFLCHPKTAMKKIDVLVQERLIIKFTTKRPNLTINFYRINYPCGKNAPLISTTTNINISSIQEENNNIGESPVVESEQAKLIKQAFPDFNNPVFLAECHKWSVKQIRTAIEKSRDKKPNPAAYLYITLTEYTSPVPELPGSSESDIADEYGKRFINGEDARWIEY